MRDNFSSVKFCQGKYINIINNNIGGVGKRFVQGDTKLKSLL